MSQTGKTRTQRSIDGPQCLLRSITAEPILIHIARTLERAAASIESHRRYISGPQRLRTALTLPPQRQTPELASDIGGPQCTPCHLHPASAVRPYSPILSRKPFTQVQYCSGFVDAEPACDAPCTTSFSFTGLAHASKTSSSIS